MADKHDSILTFMLLDSDAESLVDLLVFAKKAAKIMAQQELKHGAIDASAKYEQMSKKADSLANAFIGYLDVGEPEDGQYH